MPTTVYNEVFQNLIKQDLEWLAKQKSTLESAHIDLCWGTIKKQFGKTAMSVFKKLSKAGFDEFENYYREIIGGSK